MCIKDAGTVAIFGAGRYGKIAKKEYEKMKYTVKCFIDNNKNLLGEYIDNVPVVSLEEYLRKEYNCLILVACKDYNLQLQIEEQLKDKHIVNYEFFYHTENEFLPRIISWCTMQEMEDVVLYHVLKDEKEIFYIDVGSNDPLFGSVTKILKDMKGAKGINIEPQRLLWKQTCFERPDDINLNIGIGARKEKKVLYMQGGATTFVEEYKLSPKIKGEEVEVDTLSSVCERYVKNDRDITFLKIDTEGFEKEVLSGADLKKWHPKIIIIESVNPLDAQSVYDDWEYMLINSGYCYVCTFGCNRYYVSEELRGDYEGKLLECKNINNYYDVHSFISGELIYR